jgi:hypothetical protein
MASDDPKLTDAQRRDLERIAYSRPGPEHDADAAADALRRLLADQDATTPAKTSKRRPAKPKIVAAPPAPAREPAPDFDFDDDESFEPAAPRARSILPLLLVIGLVIGAGAGIAVAKSVPSILPVASVATAVPKAKAHPVTPNGTTEALAELSSPQTATDKFPEGGFAASLDLETNSVHRIVTTPDGVTLWIARSHSDICMLYTTAETPLGSDSAATCESVAKFGKDGLHLQFDSVSWSWHGGAFETKAS